MATKKKAADKAAQTATAPSSGFTKAAETLISLMAGAKAQGLTIGEAQTALSQTGADAGAELQALHEKGVVYLSGNGIFALTRDSEGGFAVMTGKPPATPQAPTLPQQQSFQTPTTPQFQTPVPPPQFQNGPPAGPATDDDGDDDIVDDDDDPSLPWNDADVGLALLERLDKIIAIGMAIATKLGASMAPTAAAMPTAAIPPPGNGAQSVPAWGPPPTSGGPPGYTAVGPPPEQPPQMPPMTQPWQQGPQQGPPPSYAPPQPQPQQSPYQQAPQYQQPAPQAWQQPQQPQGQWAQGPGTQGPPPGWTPPNR